VRKQGTRALVALALEAADDAVVGDALRTGIRLCTADGSLARVAEIVAARDDEAREFFAQPVEARRLDLPPELAAYLSALAPLIAQRRVAVDAGTGDGSLLDVLAPLFDHVVAVDRSDAQLAIARAGGARGFRNVDLVEGELDAVEVRKAVSRRAEGRRRGVRRAGAAPRAASQERDEGASRRWRARAARWWCSTTAHEDEALRAQQADLWLGFDADELRQLATRAQLTELVDASITKIPRRGAGTAPTAPRLAGAVARRPVSPLPDLPREASPSAERRNSS
jgi:hypothetical protein